MNQKIKTVLDNYHTTEYNTTHKDLFKAVDKLNEGEFIKIEYTKLPQQLNENQSLSDIMDDISHGHKGEHKTVYYKRGAGDVRNESGYMLFQDENDNWKSVDIRNTISITNMNGIKLTRIGQ